jgi:hypothetical protein
MAAIYSNGGNRWNILDILVFNFTKRDALSSLYKISMVALPQCDLLIVLLCLTSEDFTRQGENVGAQWVKRNLVHAFSIKCT